jgi:hypothetical protein
VGWLSVAVPCCWEGVIALPDEPVAFTPTVSPNEKKKKVELEYDAAK